MTDVHLKAVRSYNMSRVRSKDTRPEIMVRKFLFAKGFRYKLHYKKLPGQPDIVLPKYKTVIFVHGCFWHGHATCKYFVVPKTQTKWWADKINGNKANHTKAIKALKKEGWKVITVWACDLKAAKRDKAMEKVILLLST